MMGRGLLAAPWVAIEYHEGAAWSMERRMSYLAGVACGFAGPLCPDTRRGREATADEDEKLFWEYIYPEGDRKCRKKIHKVQKVADYTQAVFQLLSGY